MPRSAALRRLAVLALAAAAGCCLTVVSDLGEGAADSGCPLEQLCAGGCCPTGEACGYTADWAAPACAPTCAGPADCSSQLPCCSAYHCFTDGGDAFSTNYCVCLPAPTQSIGGDCLCDSKVDCPYFPHSSCSPSYIPTLGPGPYALTGPYTCTGYYSTGIGCPGDLTPECPDCATDHEGNRFCSWPCESDADCRNPGVSCCDTTCDAGTCCGLCGH
jgi:hypothetical protein